MRKLLCILLCSSNLWGACAYDNSAQSTIATGNFSFTLNPVSASATMGCVFVGESTARTITAITWGGTTMGAAVDTNSNSGRGVMYCLASPPTGSVTISITMTGNTTNALAVALSVTGSGTTVANHSNGGASGDPGGTAVTTGATTDCTIDGIFVNGSLGSNLAASNGQAIKQNINDSVHGQGGAVSFLTPVASPSQTLHYTNTNTNSSDAVDIDLAQGAGGAAAAGVNKASRMERYE